VHNTVHRITRFPTRNVFFLRRLFFRLAASVLLATISLPALTLAQSAEAVGTGDIEGVVYNLTNNLPVGRAKVGIKGTSQTMLTDDEGRFRFADVPAGTVELEVTYFGFDPETVTVFVESGQTAVHDFQLVREGSARSRAGDDEVVQLEAFEVVADSVMTAQAIAMNEQRHAASIKNVIALEDLGDYGTENIGDYIRFMPGVAIIDDGEDAGRLALGGFPAEMTNVQLDSGDVASTGVGTTSGRTLALQEVPMMNVERVEVTKVPTPDMPASGLGGSLNLVTKSLLGTKRPYFTYSVYMNFDNQDGLSFDGGGKQPIPQVSPSLKKPSFNTNLVVPVGKRLAFSAGVSRSWRQRPAENTPSETALWNINPVDYRDGSPKDFALATAQWSQIAQLSVTESVQLGAEWKISKNDTLSFNIQHRQVTTDRATSRLSTRFHYGLQYDPIDPAGDGSETSTKPGTAAVGGTLEMGGNASLNYGEATDNTHMTLRYKHRSDDWHIDAQAVSSAAERVRSSLGEGYFNGYYALANEKPGSTTTARGYDIVGRGINEGPSILPSSYTVTNSETGETIDPFDGGNYGLQTVREEDGVYKTDMFSGRADVTRIFNNAFSVKAGASFNRLEKDDYQVPINYTFVGDERYGDRSTTGLFERRKMSHYDVFDEDIAVTMNGDPVRWISPVKLYDLFQEHPEYFELNDTAAQYRAERSKRMIEDISSAYLRFDLRLFNQRMQVTGGVRYEKTELDGWSVKTDQMAIYERDPETGQPLKNPNGTWRYITTDPLEQIKLIYQERAFHESQKYDGFYPSLNVNYAFTDNLVLRTAYARTIGRPDVSYVVAGITVPDALEIAGAPVEDPETGADLTRSISVGNPGLKPWTADSFHLSLDSYHFKGGFGSVGVYRKNVTNFFARQAPLATREALEYYGLADADIDAILEQGFAFRRWENIGDANLTGLELSYRQDLFFLPDWLQKTQVWVNYTHLEVGGPNAEDFTGFSPDAYSWGINYIRPRFSIRLTCAYQAETKRANATPAPGTQAARYIPPGTYDYQSASTRYGITAEYNMSRAFALYLTWNNIFNEDSYIYRRAADTPGYAQNYQRLVNPSYIMIGVKGRF
jgi:Outer membrane receptor proteins, mostly Fe transport